MKASKGTGPGKIGHGVLGAIGHTPAIRLRRDASGAWHGPGFYVWYEDEAEAERWARTLAQVLPPREGARR